ESSFFTTAAKKETTAVHPHSANRNIDKSQTPSNSSMTDYTCPVTRPIDAPCLQRNAKKARIPSEVSISGQSDLEASGASSFDHFHPVDESMDAQEDEPMETAPDAAADNKERGPMDQEPNDNDDEPNWDKLCEYENTKYQIQAFLASREKRSDADSRFASAIDQFHDSVSSSIEDLVSSVVELFQTKSDQVDEYERNLNYDYIQNEKRRGDMQAKLEESARAAQGLFANLLMRIAQPADMSGNHSGDILGGAHTTAKDREDGVATSNERVDEEEPDWEVITKHEPAKTEVPIYLEARNRREVAGDRFDAAIQDFQQYTESYLQDLTQTMVDMYNERSAKLDEYESMLKQEFVNNDEVRSRMQTSIQESAAAASQMFEILMNRVMEPVQQVRVGTLTQATTFIPS
ncbi:hypothetical protein ACHAW6_006342, partial [Cyclotella cf. meneghiniana]